MNGGGDSQPGATAVIPTVMKVLALIVLLATSAEARPIKIERDNKALEFTYEWSREAAAVPALDRRFRAEAAKAYREALAISAEEQKIAREQKRDFHPQFYSKQWTTAGQSQRLLSLQYQLGTFTGGAHPNSSYGALLWERRLTQPIAIGALFLRADAFAGLTRIAYCKALNDERRKRRQGEELQGEFSQCPKYAELAISPVDKDKDGRFDEIAFVASPYTAGPYAEGEYDLVLPVTRQLIAAIKPIYRGSFEAQRQ